jgi:hypothetical protein
MSSHTNFSGCCITLYSPQKTYWPLRLHVLYVCMLAPYYVANICSDESRAWTSLLVCRVATLEYSVIWRVQTKFRLLKVGGSEGRYGDCKRGRHSILAEEFREEWGRNGRTTGRGMHSIDTNCSAYENHFLCHIYCSLLHLFCMLIGGQNRQDELIINVYLSSRISFVIL